MATDTFVQTGQSTKDFLTMKLAGWLARRASKARVAPALTWVQGLIRTALHLAGFSSLTYSAFLWDKVAGFVVLGLCCFVLSKLVTAAANVDETANRPNLRGR